MRSLVFKAKLLEAVLLKKPTWKVKSFLLSPLSHLVLPAGASPAGPSRRGDTARLGWDLCAPARAALCAGCNQDHICFIFYFTSHCSVPLSHSYVCPKPNSG